MSVGRRPAVWLAALLALLLGLALLPNAGAAESASERLGADGTREFAGADRYETAVLLAQAVVDVRPVGSAIVASGESLVDATAAASLAAVQGSVVLLTRPDHLPTSVAAFIGAAGLSEVTIVGGPAAVSVGVEAQLDAVSGVNTVSRVSGVDRYATSAAIAAQSEVPGAFCGIERSVFLVGGSSLVDAIAAGPYAYAMGMPILFTEARGLPPAVSRYLRDANIQRAVVVGDLDAVSTAVDGQLREAGIVHPWRIDGPDAPTRAVDLLKAVATCSETTISPDTVALVDGTVPIDGTTAAALLGTGLGVPNTVVPALVMGETLPAVVRHYLAPNPPSGDPSAYEHVNLLPLGGTARLTPELLAETIKAATTELPPTVTFTRHFNYSPIAHHGNTACINGNHDFIATFSTDVVAADAYDISNYTINGNSKRGSVHRRISPREYHIFFNGEVNGALGVRPNGIRTQDGRHISHHQTTEFSSLPDAPPFPTSAVYAVMSDDGLEFVIISVGGPQKYIPHGALKSDDLDRSEILVNIADETHKLVDDDIFSLSAPSMGVLSCGGAGESARGYGLHRQNGLRLMRGDSITVKTGAIVSAAGQANPEWTIPFELESEFSAHPLARGSITYVEDSSTSNVPPATVSLEPFANYPPLLGNGNLRCINPSDSYLATFSRPVNTDDASVASSYSLEVDEFVHPPPLRWDDFRDASGISRAKGIRISDTAVQLKLNLAGTGRISVNPNTIRTLDGGFVAPDDFWVEPFGEVGSLNLEPTMFAYTHDRGRRLTLLGVGAFLGRRASIDDLMALDAPDLERDRDELWRYVSRIAECDATWYRVAGSPCADQDRPERCESSDGTWFRVYRVSEGVIAPGDKLVWKAGVLEDEHGNPRPEIRVTVESFEELQANAPDPLVLSQ